MKALSGRQPWWWAILHAGKRIENRRWNTNYRGPILLHAAQGCTVDDYEDAANWMENAGVIKHLSSVPPLSELLRGGIVGRARIVDVVRPLAMFYPPGVDKRWHMTDQFGFVLDDVEPLPFVQWKGALGIFYVRDDYAEMRASL